MTEPNPYIAAPQPVAPPVSRPGNRYNVASLLTLIGGHVVVFLGGLIFAAVIILSNPVEGDQAGWNILAFILMPIGALRSGYVGIFAVVALVLAIVGMRKYGKSTFGIVMIVISALFSLQVFSLVSQLSYLPYYFSNGFGGF